MFWVHLLHVPQGGVIQVFEKYRLFMSLFMLALCVVNFEHLYKIESHILGTMMTLSHMQSSFHVFSPLES